MATATELQVPNKEGTFSGSRLFSKIARSPTSGRKHKGAPSVDVQASRTADSPPPPLPPPPSSLQDPVIEATELREGGWHDSQHRATLQRQHSDPDSSVPLNAAKDNSTGWQNHGDAHLVRIPSQSNMNVASPPQQSYLTNHYAAPAKTPPPAVITQKPMSAPLVSDVLLPHQLPNGPPPANFMYQQFHEVSVKRLATLTYMRRAHERNVFWFNTYHFSKNDISRMPSYAANRLQRRACNYFLLGLSIPAVLDVHQPVHPNNNAQTNVTLALEFLKSLNTLLSEFESYQQLHPTDGSHVSSLSRARIPQMFKRAATTSRPRRSTGVPSSQDVGAISPPAVPDTPVIGHGPHPSVDTIYTTTSNSNTTSTSQVANNPSMTNLASTLSNPQVQSPPSQTSNISFPMPSTSSTIAYQPAATIPSSGPPDAANSSIHSSEVNAYTHLLTPPLPFVPDFYAVFTTLCDVLIDVYNRLLQIVHTPSICTPNVAELFGKTDAKVRKVMIGGIMRDFEGACRDGVRKEMSGLGRVVLGGLVGQ